MSFFLRRRAAFAATRAAVLILGVAFAICANTAAAAELGDIRVVAVHGTVHATMAGVVTPLSADAILHLPAEIHTGADGAVELRQGATTVAAAADTELLIPESAAEDGLIERIVQISGNAFYNVSKREKSKLRVETPHLVAIVKGTQFNVAAQRDSATIALYEGQLEIHAADGSGIIDLHAGEIAIRRINEIGIRTLRTNGAAADVRRGSAVASSAASSSEPATAGLSAASIESDGLDTRAATSEPTDRAPAIAPTSLVGADLSAPLDAPALAAGPGGSLLDLNAGDSGAGSDIQGAMNVGAAQAATDIAADLGIGGSANISVDAGIDAGPVATDIGGPVDMGSSGANISVDAGIDASPVATDIGAAVDIGGGGDAQVAVDAAVGAGPALVDAGVNVGTDQIGASVDVGAGTGVAADVGLQDASVGADAQIGDVVGVDVDLGGDDAGVEVDVGLGDESDEGVVDTVVDTVEDVLGGLLNRRERK
jgi:hypothetical protein